MGDADDPLKESLIRAVNKGSSLLAKHALRECLKIEAALDVLISLLETQLNEEDREPQ